MLDTDKCIHRYLVRPNVAHGASVARIGGVYCISLGAVSMPRVSLLLDCRRGLAIWLLVPRTDIVGPCVRERTGVVQSCCCQHNRYGPPRGVVCEGERDGLPGEDELEEKMVQTGAER